MADWASSSTQSGPSYMNGQARGYLSAGSMSARWPVSQNNNLLSSAPPKLSAGCGGIDFYAGSLSFLKADMIVKKLQNVLQNSAGVAFQMALDTLCPKCATIMSNMEDLSNKLNAMSMDDCSTAKGVMTGVRDMSMNIAEGIRQDDVGSALELGLSNSYSDMKAAVPAVATLSDVNTWTTMNKGMSSTTIASMAGCPADIQKLFPADSNQYPISVLKVVANDMSLPAGYVNLLRGLVGDVKINSIIGGDVSLPIEYVGACPNSKNITIDDINTGNIWSRTETGICSVLPSADTNMITYVDVKMQAVMSALLTKSALSTADVSFVTAMPTSVLYGLRVAITTGQQLSLTPMLVKTAAAGLSMKAMRDLLARYEEIMSYMHQTGKLSNFSAECQLGKFQGELDTKLGKITENIDIVNRIMSESFQTSLQEFTTSYSMNNQLKNLDSQLKGEIARTFGASVAQRAMRTL